MLRSGAPIRRGGSARAAFAPSGDAPAWTPADLAAPGRVYAWYDYNDLSTLFQDSAGTTPVTAAGQPVGKVVDKSGGGFDWTAMANDTTRPTLRTDPADNNYLEFNAGENDRVHFLDSIFADSFENFVAMGFRPASTADGVMFVNRATVGNAINPQFDISSGFYRYALRDDAGTLSIATSTSGPDTASNQILIGKRQGGVTSIAIDGAEQDTDNTALGAVTEFDDTYLGDFGGSLYKGGRYYPMVAVSGAVTAEEEADILDWTATKASRDLSPALAAEYAACGSTGDYWKVSEPGQVTVNGSDEVTSIAGSRATINLVSGGGGGLPGPLEDIDNGFVRFVGTGVVDRVLDPSVAPGTLGAGFFLAAYGKYTDGDLRLVIVDAAEPHDAWFDIRIGENGVRGIVQDAQANIAVIPGITLPAPDTLFYVTVERTANGNATLTVNGESGTIVKGSANGAASANTRYSETQAPTGHDFRLGNSLLMVGGTLPDSTQKATIQSELNTYS